MTSTGLSERWLTAERRDELFDKSGGTLMGGWGLVWGKIVALPTIYVPATDSVCTERHAHLSYTEVFLYMYFYDFAYIICTHEFMMLFNRKCVFSLDIIQNVYIYCLKHYITCTFFHRAPHSRSIWSLKSPNSFRFILFPSLFFSLLLSTSLWKFPPLLYSIRNEALRLEAWTPVFGETGLFPFQRVRSGDRSLSLSILA